MRWHVVTPYGSRLCSTPWKWLAALASQLYAIANMHYCRVIDTRLPPARIHHG
jgi:hypothetical protein